MKTLIYLSLGAGVQSSALYVLTTLGLYDCPRADVAIFADTQDEPSFVYKQLDRLEQWGEANHGPRILRVSKGRMSRIILDAHRYRRKASIPAYTANGLREGQLRRQCTREYKIDPIEQGVRWLLGLGFRSRAVGRVSATALIGISRDEAHRMKPSRSQWVTNRYPLVDAGLRRADCLRVLTDAGLPQPEKSACVFCPYHDDRYWRRLQERHPAEFARAVTFDAAFRNMSRSGVKNPVYLHRSLKPLGEIDFSTSQLAFDGFGNECEGVCGV